jgi:hypothetical protein
MLNRQSELSAALIIGYRRHSLLESQINVLVEGGIKRIYISLDAAGNKDSEYDVNLTLEVAKALKRSRIDVNITIATHSKNVGCAAGVLSACDWFFSQEKFGLILEDDCIPTVDFINFCADAREHLIESEKIWLICGTQFAPSYLSFQTWNISKYALIWGWATSDKKWHEIATSLHKPTQISRKIRVKNSERRYWMAGARRATLGIVDAWDSLLVSQMISAEKFALLPSASLVRNVGFDSAATHTTVKNQWLDHTPAFFVHTDLVPQINSALDDWLRKKFYRISFRHLFSTRITQVIDLLLRRSDSSETLEVRWTNAVKNFTHDG